MTFEATVVRVTHEGSVLATFEGTVPRLGQRVKDRKGETIGRIDSVIGPIGDPLTNIVILDPHLDASTLIGDTLVFSPRTKKDSGRNDRGRSWNRSSDDRRGNQRFRGQDRRRSRDNDRGNQRFRGQDRGRSRDNDRGNQQTRDGDWDCKSCGNNNFSFRTECNRCGKSKSGGGTNQRSERRPQRRQDSRSDSRRGPRNNGNRSRNNRGGQRGSRGSNNFRDRNRR